MTEHDSFLLFGHALRYINIIGGATTAAAAGGGGGSMWWEHVAAEKLD